MTDSPRILADRPATPADALRSPREFADPPALEEAALGLDADTQPRDLLSELLRSVRLSGERIVAYAPLRTFSIGFADVGSLHIIEEGELALRVDADPHLEHVSCGDFVLLPRGDPHHISDAGKRADATVRAGAAENDAPEPARWLCGTFTIGDPQASHLLASLPAVIILRGARGPALEGLDVARRMLVFEMQSPSQGSVVMVARILDLIFIQILRLGRWHGRRTELAGRCARPADRSRPERYPPRPGPRLDSRGAGPSVQPFPVGVRCAVRRSRREAASHLSRARTPRRRHRPAPRHLPCGHGHREEGRLHIGGGIQPRVQEPLRHATGSLAARHTSETGIRSLTPLAFRALWLAGGRPGRAARRGGRLGR
jgi:hypothetical protein